MNSLKKLTWLQNLEKNADRPWYPFILAALALVDLFIVIVPNDGIIVVSTASRPKKWFVFGLAMTMGSLVGSLLLALLTRHYGEAFINWLSPSLLSSETWLWTENFFKEWGVWAVLGAAASPMAQQPTILLAALSEMPYSYLALCVFIGRAFKFLSYAWVASHFPKLLKKLPGLNKELRDLKRPN